MEARPVPPRKTASRIPNVNIEVRNGRTSIPLLTRKLKSIKEPPRTNAEFPSRPHFFGESFDAVDANN
jgi:hypothetical protein